MQKKAYNGRRGFRRYARGVRTYSLAIKGHGASARDAEVTIRFSGCNPVFEEDGEAEFFMAVVEYLTGCSWAKCVVRHVDGEEGAT